MGNKGGKLSPEDLDDIANHTEFTELEIRQWYKSFRKDCPSGILSLEEFKKLYREFFPSGDASAFAEHAFRTFDKNKDGTIDFREFMVALSVTSRGTFDDKLNWAFSMYDLDKDGNVTREEMLEIMKAIYKMVGNILEEDSKEKNVSPEERVDKIFAKMDKNNDNKISIQEFQKAAHEDPSLVMLLQNSSSGGQQSGK